MKRDRRQGRGRQPDAEQVVPTAEFNDMLRTVSANVGRVIADKPADRWGPMMALFLDAQGKRVQLPVALAEMPEGDAKREMLSSMGKQFAAKGLRIVACFIMTEAWIKTMTPAEGLRAKSAGIMAPSKYPDRTEAVVIMGRTPDGRANMAMAPIQRGAGGRIGLGPWAHVDCAPEKQGEGFEDNLLAALFAGYLLGMRDRMGKDATP